MMLMVYVKVCDCFIVNSRRLINKVKDRVTIRVLILGTANSCCRCHLAYVKPKIKLNNSIVSDFVKWRVFNQSPFYIQQ